MTQSEISTFCFWRKLQFLQRQLKFDWKSILKWASNFGTPPPTPPPHSALLFRPWERISGDPPGFATAAAPHDRCSNLLWYFFVTQLHSSVKMIVTSLPSNYLTTLHYRMKTLFFFPRDSSLDPSPALFFRVISSLFFPFPDYSSPGVFSLFLLLRTFPIVL